MNVDASAGVRADVTTGVTVPILGTAAAVMLVIGALIVIAGSTLIVAPVITRGSRRPQQPIGHDMG